MKKNIKSQNYLDILSSYAASAVVDTIQKQVKNFLTLQEELQKRNEPIC